MAIDTRDRRFSFLGFGQPMAFPYVLPGPDGNIDVDDRAHFLFLYPGINLAEPGGEAEAGSENMFYRRRRAER